MNIRTLLELGQTKQDADHAEQERLKAGNLRGGSAGVVGTDGKIYGECHRMALARLLGVDKEHEPNRAVMFDAGRHAENIWAEKLTAAGVEFRREDEIPIKWQVPGTERVVTGRPDIVIGTTISLLTMPPKEQFQPTHGLELKGVYSASTAVGVELEGRPQSKHLVQAGFYSMALGDLPYTLCYTNPSVFDVPYWAQKRFPGRKKLQPFYRLFDLRWNGDGLEYKDENSEEWVTTVITRQGIADFYLLVVEMEAKRELGPRPSSDHVNGEKAKWDVCAYCPLKDACDNHGDAFDNWLAAARDK